MNRLNISLVLAAGMAAVCVSAASCGPKIVVRDKNGSTITWRTDPAGSTMEVMPAEEQRDASTVSPKSAEATSSDDRQSKEAAIELTELREQLDGIRGETSKAINEKAAATTARDKAIVDAKKDQQSGELINRQLFDLCNTKEDAEKYTATAVAARAKATEMLADSNVQLRVLNDRLAGVERALTDRRAALTSIEADLARKRGQASKTEADLEVLHRELARTQQDLKATQVRSEDIRNSRLNPHNAKPTTMPTISAATPTQPTAPKTELNSARKLNGKATGGSSLEHSVSKLSAVAPNTRSSWPIGMMAGVLCGCLLLVAVPLYFVLHRGSLMGLRIVMEAIESDGKPEPIEFTLGTGDQVPINDAVPDGTSLRRRGRGVTLMAPRDAEMERVWFGENQEVRPGDQEALTAGSVFHVVRPGAARRSYYVRDLRDESEESLQT